MKFGSKELRWSLWRHDIVQSFHLEADVTDDVEVARDVLELMRSR